MRPRIIAFYLPQFHPIPENDEWWGKGFTEWTNVGKAKRLFPGHYQPRVPADLGYYDLRVPETREAQANMAREAGIEGFCYWHYWFGSGKRLLERPFNEVLESGKPDFPFCLGWANHNWMAKNWNKSAVKGKDRILIEQKYPGDEDFINHFNTMMPAFKDKRYLKIDGKLIFLIWEPLSVPNVKHFIELWNSLALKNDLNGFYFIGFSYNKDNEEVIYKQGFDSVCLDMLLEASLSKRLFRNVFIKVIRRIFCSKIPHIVLYKQYTKFFLKEFVKTRGTTAPCIIPNYDHTPRSGNGGIVLSQSTPENFFVFLNDVIKNQRKKQNAIPLLFLKSWNEWGEGNHLEPDLRFGCAYLEAIKNSILCPKEECKK